MPLTLAHPAAAVPLRRLGLPLSALVVGSISPDFAKIFTLRPSVGLGHSLDGIFWFCIPTGLVALALFHFLLKRPLLELVPEQYARRLAPYLDNSSWRQIRRLPVVCLALGLGAFTHLFWDGFTHADGWIAHHIPFLYETVFEWQGQSVKGYKIGQHGSTIVGMALLTFWAVGWLYRAPGLDHYKSIWPFTITKVFMLVGLLFAAIIPAVAFGIWKSHDLPDSRMMQVFAGRTAVAGMAMTFVSVLIYSIVFAMRFRRARVEELSG